MEGYKIFGYLVAFLCTYILSFQGVLLGMDMARNPLAMFVLVNLIAIILLWVLWGMKKEFFRSKSALLELEAMLVILFSGAILLLAWQGVSLNTVVVNAALVIFAILNILMGVELHSPAVFNLGIAVFSLFIITRYVDVGWRLKEKSLFFIVGGLIILALGIVLERERRKFLERIKEI